MSNHIQIVFSDIEPEQQEWVIAHLAEAGYDGFEEGPHELKAFIPEELYNRSLLKEMVFKYQLSYSEQLIEAQNWNAVWESNFHPVIVNDFAAIRAHFHEHIQDVKHEIVITPKMSFGTGHHATTYMMIQQMEDIDFTNKTVLDFGTGTGVLAILAEKLHAKKIIAIDIDDWSMENAAENIDRNKCSAIQLKQADSADINGQFDIILANINRNVILDNLEVLSDQLLPGGILLVSGILAEDEADIGKSANLLGLKLGRKTGKDNWLCLKYLHRGVLN